MNVAPTFGQRIKQRRAALDLTQEALAERVGCAPQTIRKIESGERRPSRDMAERLALVLELAPEERESFLKAARASVIADTAVAAAPAVEQLEPRLLLPKYTRPFVGRTAELAQLRSLLADPACQLITLVGAGGIGKTRLAVELGSQCRLFADGVVFVSLVSVKTPTLLASAIADALGFTFHGTDEPTAQLFDYLREKELLLILDNMEQLLDSTDLLVELLTEAPHVKLLVTSRERLNMQGEWAVEIGGLQVRHSDADVAEAVALFVERARRVKHTFSLSDAEQRSVVRICQLVEGMPLAIELAASWVRMLSCSEIEAEISNSFDILSTSTRDMPGRHQSLRAVFEHSWHLLSDEERQVLCQLTVFRGGFDRSAAARVAGATLPVLAALVDKSLLRRTGDGRFDLHELVRQYAAEFLAQESQEQAAARDRHASYFIAWVESRTPALIARNQAATIREVSAEIDNIRAAWDWATTQHKLSDIRLGLAPLQWFYEFRTWFQEGELIFRNAANALKALAVVTEADSPNAAAENTTAADEYALLLGQLLARQGYFTLRCGQLERAREILRRSLALLQQHNDEGGTAAALVYLGIVAYQMGNYAEADRLLNDGLRISIERGDAWVRALSLCFLGLVAHAQGDYELARRLFSEDLAVWRAIDNVRGMVLCLNYFSTTLYKLGEYAEAQALLHESLTLCSATGDRFGLGTALSHLGLVAKAQGQFQEAHYLFSESLTLFKEMGNRWDIARTLNHFGVVALALGECQDAKRAYIESLRNSIEANAVPDALNALVGLARASVCEGNREQALELCLQVLQHPAPGKEAYERAEQLRAQLVTELPPAIIDEAAGRMASRTFSAAVDELLLPLRERMVAR